MIGGDEYLWIHIYRVRDDLDEKFIADSLECNCIWDIDPGTYREIGKQWIDYKDVNELIVDLEAEQVETEIRLMISDLLEMVPDTEMLNMGIVIGDDNFLIITEHGVERIAVDKSSVFRELSLSRLQELFNLKYERYL